MLSVLAGGYVNADVAPIAVVADGQGKSLYVAGFEAKKIVVIDVASSNVEREISLSMKPTGVSISADGKKLYITGGGYHGRLETIDISSGKSIGSVGVGHTPTSPVLSADGGKLYVCNSFTDDVSVVDLAKSKEIKRIDAVRQPSASAITPDGKILFVANLIPAGAADGDYAAAAVTVIDTSKDEIAATLQLLNGSMGVSGVCVSPDGNFAYVTHILGRYQLPTTQLERGWMNTNAL
ncbi:MAG: YncE family protein, partial [Anaerohalosphaera sp.]|nr:YncE family protein [Anaerohalosphaera sp.]